MSSAVLCVAKAKQFQMKALPQRDRALPLPPGNLSTLHLTVTVCQTASCHVPPFHIFHFVAKNVGGTNKSNKS
jgi:hypothetical protein